MNWVDQPAERPILLLTAPGGIPEVLGDLAGSLEHREIDSLEEVDDSSTPAVLILTDALLQDAGTDAVGCLPESVVILSSGAAAREAAESAGRLFFPLEDVPDADTAQRILRSALGYAAAVWGTLDSRSQLSQVRRLARPPGGILQKPTKPNQRLGALLGALLLLVLIIYVTQNDFVRLFS